MNEITLKAQAAQVIRELGLGDIKPDWTGCDPVWNVLEEIGKEGAIVVVKIDGQRKSLEDNGRYTILLSDGPLGEDFFRTDTHVLEEGLAKAILYYAEKCWNHA